jgi:hypothetical protein
LQLRRGSSVRVTNTADRQRCSQRADHIFGLKFLIRFARLREGQIGTFIGRKPVALARPRAEIVRLASVRAEWPPLGIRCPCDRCTAHRTLDDARSFRHQNQGPAKGALHSFVGADQGSDAASVEKMLRPDNRSNGRILLTLAADVRRTSIARAVTCDRPLYSVEERRARAIDIRLLH